MSQRKHVLSFSDPNLFMISRQKNARGQNDQDNCCDRYKYSDSFGFNNWTSSHRKKVKISKLSKVQTTIHKFNDHHEKFSIVYFVMSTKFWKSVCPPLFKYCGDITKTGDKLSVYFVFINLIIIPQFSSHLNKSCYTSDVSRP